MWTPSSLRCPSRARSRKPRRTCAPRRTKSDIAGLVHAEQNREPSRMRFAAALAALCFAFATAAKADSTPVCTTRIFETSRFTVCAVDTRQESIRLAWTDNRGVPLRSFARLASAMGTEAGRVAFAMNAGMFDQQGNPIGLFVADSDVRMPVNTGSGSGNFYLKPNGVFWVAKDG